MKPIEANEARGRFFAKYLVWWVDVVFRHATFTLAVTGLFTIMALYYTVNNIAFNTSTHDMLSKDLPFRQTDTAFKQHFPQFKDTLLIVVDADTPELARQSANKLASQLRAKADLFKSIYQPGGGSFFTNHGLIYLKQTKLEDLADRLAKIQPFLGTLTEDMSLRGLMAMLNSAMEAQTKGVAIDLKPIFMRMQQAIEAELDHKRYTVSWEELMMGKQSAGRRQFIVAQAVVNYSKVLASKSAIHAIRNTAKALQLDAGHGVRVRITGGLAMAYEELISVSHGIKLTGIISLLLVILVLFLGLRSIRLVMATMAALIIGLILTATFATIAIGHLNLISIAFAVLYIGLGVDYAIHLCLRFQELSKQGESVERALHLATRDVGVSLILCAITTAIGFYCFVPTAYAGVSELGMISGTGMFISLMVTMTILPAMFRIWETKLSVQRSCRAKPYVDAVSTFPIRQKHMILATVVLAGFIALWLLPQTKFDYNPVHLRDPHSESVITFKDLMSQSATVPWPIVVLAADANTARQYEARLKQLHWVDHTVSIFDYVPDMQNQRLAIIEDIDLMMGEILQHGSQVTDTSATKQMAMLHTFKAHLAQDGRQTAQHLMAAIDQLLITLQGMNTGKQQQLLTHVQGRLLNTLPASLERLQRALQVDSFALKDIPAALRKRWVSADGMYRLEVFPKEDITNNEALRRFVSSVQKVIPNASGAPVFIFGAGQAIIHSFVQAFLTAVTLIFIFLLLLMRNFKDSLMVVVPLLLAAAFIGAVSMLMNIPFNFANIIALPLLMGVGVDNGIHMVQRLRTGTANSLRTSTTRAMIFSAMTTVCSFGSLSFSPHAGTASMGQILTMGMIIVLMTTLLVTPALLAEKGKNKS